MRGLALREAYVEYAEYFFCFRCPLHHTAGPKRAFSIRYRHWSTRGLKAWGRDTSPSHNFSVVLSIGDFGQQHRGGFCLAGPSRLESVRAALIRDGTNLRVRAGWLLDAYWVRTIGRRFRVYPA